MYVCAVHNLSSIVLALPRVSNCGTVGRWVACNTGDLQFKSQHFFFQIASHQIESFGLARRDRSCLWFGEHDRSEGQLHLRHRSSCGQQVREQESGRKVERDDRDAGIIRLFKLETSEGDFSFCMSCNYHFFCKTIYSFPKTGHKECRKQIITYF